MKGPGLRLTLAVERRWSCPACGRKVITDGDVTTLSCSCTDPPRWMKMEDPKTNPRPAPRMPDAQTLNEEDLDRLGIEPLKEPPPEATTVEQIVAESSASELLPDETTENLEIEADMNSQPGGEASGETVSEIRVPQDAQAPEPALPPSTDEFGAGLDEED